MRILDDKLDKSLNMVSIFLTENEAIELIGHLEHLIENKKKILHDHSHFMSNDHRKEIMICLYEPEKANNFNPRIQKLILNDE